MNRRNLLKNFINSTIMETITLPSFSFDNNILNTTTNNLSITPHQTDIYQFSTPLYFNHAFIDEMAELNTKFKKSQVVTLYNSLPYPLANNFNDYLNLQRGYNFNIKTFKDFSNYIKHAKDNNFNVVYLFNSPKPLNNNDFSKLKKEFYTLLDNLKLLNIKTLKVATVQSADLVNEYNRINNLNKEEEFKLAISTIFEIHTLPQYINLINNYPNIVNINISKDENQNFYLLKNLKTLYPDITIEMMIDEGCNKGCPARISHMSCWNCAQFDCQKMQNTNNTLYFFKNGKIFPWHFPYYSALNINNFKTVTYQKERGEETHQPSMLPYFKVTEYGIDSLSKEDIKHIFAGGVSDEVIDLLPLKDIISYLPDINYLIKHGNFCASLCESYCTYCHKKADKFNKVVQNIINLDKENKKNNEHNKENNYNIENNTNTQHIEHTTCNPQEV